MKLDASEKHINYHRIETAIQYLEENFLNQPDLEDLAEKVHLSPFHFQRIFTEWAGISPKRFLQYLTIDYLKAKLASSKNLMDVAEKAGLSSQSRVYDLFTTLEAVTPLEYKQQGRGIRIDYGFHETPFGTCLIGITERGICWLSFLPADSNVKQELEAMKEHWHNSIFHESPEFTNEFVHRIFGANYKVSRKLHLFVKGTNFQIKVWEALLTLPMGALTTYQDIACAIKNQNALQAVGSAIGANHIAYLIPCHRVIRKSGILGEYRWGSLRKKSLIGWEMAKTSP